MLWRRLEPYLENLVLKLLARGLQAYGNKIPTKRSYMTGLVSGH